MEWRSRRSALNQFVTALRGSNGYTELIALGVPGNGKIARQRWFCTEGDGHFEKIESSG